MQEPGPPGRGLDARLTALPSKRITVAKSEEMKTESILTEFSKEGYGSESTILPMMMTKMVAMMMIPLFSWRYTVPRKSTEIPPSC
jgi:hypothetical protein